MGYGYPGIESANGYLLSTDLADIKFSSYREVLHKVPAYSAEMPPVVNSVTAKKRKTMNGFLLSRKFIENRLPLN